MSKVQVKPGQIKQRVPRPLTRDEAGGDATADDLARLEAAFAKPQRKRQAEDTTKVRNNGWGS